MLRVALDAMGGDFAPKEPVLGAVLAVNKDKDVTVFLSGKEDELKALLSDQEYDKDRIKIIPATEVITNSDHPVQAIRTKKDSSMAVGMKLVRDGEADAFVSAGNSGALMVGAQVLVGRLKGVDRAPFAHYVPTAKGRTLILDCGANVDVRPDHLVSFALLGSEYVKADLKIDNPRVGILNVGAEEEKGNELVKTAFPLLKECPDINFIGSVEPTSLTDGVADVVVCDGFAGNVMIKLYEGVGRLMKGMLKGAFTGSLKAKIGAAFAMSSIKKSMKAFDTKEYGGAPILGLKGLVIKAHGNATAEIFCNSILQCRK